MEPGDLVEFKDGLFGIAAPDNVGIVQSRDKQGKTVRVTLFTVEGPRKVEADSLSRVDFETGLEGDEDGATLRDALDELGAALQAARGAPPGEPTDRDLWEAVDADAYTPHELAAAYYGLDRTLPGHVASVADALEACRPGVGYFRRDGRRWRPIPDADVQEAREAIRKVNGLRNALVHQEIVETDEGEDRTRYRPVEDPELGPEDEEALEIAVAYMEDFLLHDEDRGRVHLGDTEVHTIDGFALGGFCRHLARDATGQEGGSNSGAYARFLLELGVRDVEALYALIVRRHVLASPFDLEVPDVARRAADRLEPYTHEPDREDLRDLPTVTIDPPDAQDFDDAISLTDDALWVHIADVSHYVEPGTSLDSEASRRGTSVYLPTRVLPMLPDRLADDLCSLRAGEDRPAVSVRLPLDGADPTFHLATVRVDENLAYDEVLDWIDEGREPYASLHDLATRWRDRREGLDLDTGEVRIQLAREGVQTRTKRATRATRLIEAFMVAANEAVAEHLTDRDVPLPYRCHPLPDRAGVETFNGQARALGLDVGINLPEDDGAPGGGQADDDAMLEALKSGGKLEMGYGGAPEGPDDEDGDDAAPDGPARRGLAQLEEDERRAWLEPFQAALDRVDAVEDDAVRDVAYMKLLGCLGRAFYTADNVGHFGLGSTCYLHFTSPIRRYPDLMVHRQLKATLAGEDPPIDRETLEPRCERSTDQAVAAETLEWDLKDVALTFQTLEERWQGVHTGVVNGLTPGGAFLTLEGGLEARLPVEELPGRVEVDDHDARLVDRDGETVLQLGQRVAVRLTGRDLAEGRVAATLESIGRAPAAEGE